MYVQRVPIKMSKFLIRLHRLHQMQTIVAFIIDPLLFSVLLTELKQMLFDCLQLQKNANSTKELNIFRTLWQPYSPTFQLPCATTNSKLSHTGTCTKSSHRDTSKLVVRVPEL